MLCRNVFSKRISPFIPIIALLLFTLSSFAGDLSRVDRSLKKLNPEYKPSSSSTTEKFYGSGVGNIAPLSALKDLTDLKLYGPTGRQLKNPKGPRAKKVKLDLSPLSGLKSLKYILLSGYPGLENIDVLRSLGSLDTVLFYYMDFTEFAFLGDKTRIIKLYDCPNIKSLNSLDGYDILYYVYVEKCPGITSLKGFSTKSLLGLKITDCPIKSLDGLEDAVRLKTLTVPSSVTDFSSVLNLPDLKMITVGEEVYSMRELKKLSKKSNDEEEDKEKEDKEAALKAAKEVALQKKLAKKFRYNLTELSDYIVIFECGDAVGSGFVAEEDGETYVYTNQHVVFGSKSFKVVTLNGERLRPTSYDYSQSRDIIRFKIDKRKSLKFARKPPELDSGIVVCGNSAGAGVATQIYGVVNGLGPDKLEVTAKFVQGNSGSPILNTEMEVVGIATYATKQSKKKGDWVKEGTRFSEVRRFGYRFNHVEWKTYSWKNFTEVSKKIDAIEKESSSLFKVAVAWANKPFVTLKNEDGDNWSLNSWISSSNRLVKKYDGYKEKLSRRYSTQELSRVNKALGRDLLDNWKKLSVVCLAVEKKGRGYITKYKKQLSEYQISELRKHTGFMEYLAEEIVVHGNESSRRDFFYYKDDKD